MANYNEKKPYIFSISCGKLWHIFFIIVYIINYTKILEMKEYICIIIDYSLPQDIECSSLCYTVGAYYLSILCIIVCKCQSPWSINHHIFPSNFLTLDQSVLAQKPTLPPWLLNRTDRPKIFHPGIWSIGRTCTTKTQNWALYPKSHDPLQSLLASLWTGIQKWGTTGLVK